MSRGSRWDSIFGSTYKGRVQLGPQPATRLRTKREGLGVQGSWDKVTLGQAAEIEISQRVTLSSGTRSLKSDH